LLGSINLHVGQSSVGQLSVGQSSVGQSSVCQSSVGQSSVDQLPWSRICTYVGQDFVQLDFFIAVNLKLLWSFYRLNNQCFIFSPDLFLFSEAFVKGAELGAFDAML
jgi:hypothetical protein